MLTLYDIRLNIVGNYIILIYYIFIKIKMADDYREYYPTVILQYETQAY